MQYVNLIVEILSALIVIIPLGVKLYNTLVALSREKNWSKVVSMVSVYMSEAEGLMVSGADRKAYVMAMIQTTADQLNFTMTPDEIKNIDNLIDDLCNMTKVVNATPIVPVDGEA